MLKDVGIGAGRQWQNSCIISTLIWSDDTLVAQASVPSTRNLPDFFISHAYVDTKVAEWIAWWLEDAGYDVILDKWDFRPGHNFVLRMHYSASTAKHLIAILSPAYVDALYTHPEWAAFFAEDPTGEKRRLIPIRIQECKLDGLLKQIVYIDLVELLKIVELILMCLVVEHFLIFEKVALSLMLLGKVY